MPANLDALWKILEKTKRLLIVTHDNPDPDALGSACALARLVSAKTAARSRICCEGIAGRSENRAMARLLRLKPMAASRVNWRKWPSVALVDCQPGTGNNSFPARRAPDVVIDHHPSRMKRQPKYLDLRPGYGACATILTEYLFDAGVTIAPDLAAGLCYAISSETQDLNRECDPADGHAYVRLYPLADKRGLGRILHPRLSHAYFSTLSRALLSAFTYANIIGSHLGEISHPDAVSLVADLLLRHERMSWSVATGVWRGGLHVSLRTTHPRAKAGALLRRVLGRNGHAGGHDTMAGGRLDMTGLDDDEMAQLPNQISLRLIRILKRRKDVELKPLIEIADLDPGCKPPGRVV